ANIDLYSAPCDAAENLFTGVLYDAVSFPTLPEQHHAVALETTRVFSGLFGVVNLDDVLPNHRLAMGTKLPDIGPLPTYWKKPLDTS
ncbi:peroxide stress protein YaaA, partial [Pauljensenia sp. UMB3104]